jgi:hypothetical protein
MLGSNRHIGKKRGDDADKIAVATYRSHEAPP